MCLRKILMIW